MSLPLSLLRCSRPSCLYYCCPPAAYLPSSLLSSHLFSLTSGTLVGPDDWTSGGQNTWSSDDGWFDVDISAMGGFTWYGRRETMVRATPRGG